jgi:hypothetical protein
MDSEKINQADREFVEKLDHLRTRLSERQAGAERKKKIFGPPGILVVVVLVAAGLGTRHFLQGPTAPPAALAPEAAGTAAPIAGTADRPPGDTPDSGKAVAAQQTGTTVEPPSDTPQAPALPPQAAAPVPDAPPAANSLPAQAAGPTDTIRVASAVVCSGIRRHHPMDETGVFQISPATRAFVWTDVRTASPPMRIEHIYYLNGVRYCAVPLEIRYPRMRTWSSVMLQQTDLSGDWRVDIRSGGDILKTVHFNVLE